MGREVPGEVVRNVSSVEDRFVTSGVVKVGWRDGCVDVWIVKVMVWGAVVVGWGMVPAPRPREMSISGCSWSATLTALACGVGGSDVNLCLLRGFRVPVEGVAVYVSVGHKTRLSGRLGLVHGGL